MADKKYRLKSCLDCPGSDSADWSLEFYCNNYRDEIGFLQRKLLTSPMYVIPTWCQLEDYDCCGKECKCA